MAAIFRASAKFCSQKPMMVKRQETLPTKSPWAPAPQPQSIKDVHHLKNITERFIHTPHNQIPLLFVSYISMIKSSQLVKH